MRAKSESSASGDAESAVVARLTARIESLEKRQYELVREIEVEKKSHFKRVSKWAGLVALFLAICGGVFTIIDKVLVEPKKTREAEIANLQTIIGDLTKVNAELVQLSHNVSIDKLMEIARTQNGVKFTLMNRAMAIIEKYKDYVDTATMLLISGEFYNAQDLNKSIRLSQMAFDSADTDLLRAEAKKYIANATILKGNDDDIINAQSIYNDAIKLARKVSGLQGAGIMGNVYRDWIISIASLNMCDRLPSIFEDMRNRFAEQNATNLIQAYKSEIFRFLRQRQYCQSSLQYLETL